MKRNTKNKNMNTIFSEKNMMTMDTWESGLNNNVVVIGSSGSGKTRRFVKPNLLQKNASYIISDPKGTLIKECGAFFAEKQDANDIEYVIKVLNLIDLSKSMHYNPLAYIRNEDDIYALVEFIIANNSLGERVTNDSFWNESASMLLTALIGFVYYNLEESDVNFNSVMKLLDMAKVMDDDDAKDDLDLLFEVQEKQCGDCLEVRFYNKYKTIKGRTKASVLATLCSILAPWELTSVKELIRYDELELDKIGDRHTALFVMLSDMDDSKNFLAGILYSQLFQILCNKADNNVGGRLYVPTRFFLDDFACVGKIPKFERVIASIRSREISACIILQNESQLESRYGDIAPNIIGNCDTYLFMGSNDLDTCRHVAERLNQKASDILLKSERKCYVFSGQYISCDTKYSLEKHPRYAAGKLFDYRYLLKNNLPKYVERERGGSRALNLQEAENVLKCNEKNTVSTKEHIDEDIKEIDRFLLEFSPMISEEEKVQSFDKISREKGNELRNSFFDSSEEEFFYQGLVELLEKNCFYNLQVDTHVHLNEIFSNPASVLEKNKYKYRLINQHCDFLIRNKYDLSVIMGIEIDGCQHLISQEQKENDEYKNRTFENNKVSLLRISASEVKNSVVWKDKILKIIDKSYEVK